MHGCVEELPTSAEVRRRQQESSVRHLQNLYSITVAVALGFAFEHVIAAESKATAIALLCAFVATLIPFYHGALRYLDDSYIFLRTNRTEALLPEFVARFVESCLFFALAAAIERPLVFASLYIVLLVTNIAWTRLTELFCVSDTRASAAFDWREVNVVTVVAAVSFVSLLDVSDHTGSVVLQVGIVGLAFARTAADYFKSWEFYTASRGGGSEPAAPEPAAAAA